MAARAVAFPGASEHQTGLAIDVSVNGKLSTQFGETEAGVWLQNHCHHYGFIIRYPKNKTHITRIMYEPWHLRYVGVPHAHFMHEYGMCLEEYVEYVKNAGILLYWLDDENYFKITYTRNVPDFPEVYDISALGSEGTEFVVTELKVFGR
jgi:D-alanyl-D-alanine carboxypeptidase